MGIDLSRVAAAAVDAALEDSRPHRRLSAPKAIATGAALALAARYAVTKAPHLPRIPGVPHVPHLSDVSDRLRDGLRDRLAERGRVEGADSWGDGGEED